MDSRTEGWTATVELMVLIPLSLVLLRSGRPRIRRLVARQTRAVWAILPSTRAERRAFVAVAVTAGVSEEVLYRWFLPLYVRWLAPGLGAPALVAITGLAFGAVHWYQGRWGVIATTLAGVGFGAVTMATGTLLPAVIVHTLVDLRIIGLPALPLPPDATAIDSPEAARPPG